MSGQAKTIEFSCDSTEVRCPATFEGTDDEAEAAGWKIVAACSPHPGEWQCYCPEHAAEGEE